MPNANTRSAMYCGHANEMPSVCPCPHDCYCRRQGTCRARVNTPPEAPTVDDGSEAGTAVDPFGGGRRTTVPGMRVKIKEGEGTVTFGVFVGLLYGDSGDLLAVVMPDHWGLVLKAVHPSAVTPTTSAEEDQTR